MLQQFPNKILWLASYPKSGNTWFRAFITALLNDGEVEINKLGTDGIFSARKIFDNCADIDSCDLYDAEVKLMIADVFRDLANKEKRMDIIKVHDAFEADMDGKNIIPEDVTHCAIYFIRNPLDIAGSFANHMHSGIQAAVDKINDTSSSLSPQTGNLNINRQFRQYLSDWSSHVNSWTLRPSFPVCVVRYEDMLENTFETFQKILAFIGWAYTPGQILKAMAASSFDALSRQEAEKGFNEKAPKSPKFFRSGTKGNWEFELTLGQIKEITAMHGKIMNKYGY